MTSPDLKNSRLIKERDQARADLKDARLEVKRLSEVVDRLMDTVESDVGRIRERARAALVRE